MLDFISCRLPPQGPSRTIYSIINIMIIIISIAIIIISSSSIIISSSSLFACLLIYVFSA